jgi:hypothetical protein
MSRNRVPIIAAAKKTIQRFAFDADVEIVAATAGEDGKQSVPTFRIIAYNGGELRTAEYIAKFGKPVVIDLAGLSYSANITANMDHDPTQRVGHVTEKTNDGRQLILAGIVSGTGSAAREVVDNAARSYPWQASVEAIPTSPLEEVRAGQSVIVNGRTIVGPALIARKSRLFGVAFLARGADETTSVSIAASAAEPAKELDMKFEEWIIAMGFAAADLTPVQTAALQKKYDVEIKASAVNPEILGAGTKFDVAGLQLAFAKSDLSIDAAASEYAGTVETMPLNEIKATGMVAVSKLKRTALAEEWAPTRYEVEVIKAEYAMRADMLAKTRPKGPAIHSRDNSTISGDVIEAAACRVLGIDVEKSYKPEVLESAHRNFRNLGLQEMFIMAASQNGYSGRHRINTDNIREVLQYALPSTPIHASASTVSLSGILSNIANKMLLAGFMEEDQTWREFADVKPVSDFKTHTSYRMLDDMEYEQLGANGEIRHGKVGDETFERSADTFAKMFALTRKMIINDDLGAFDDLRTRLGRGASRKFRKLFWSTFINNSAFFTAARTNYITGATSNLAIDGVGLQLAITNYRKMKSTDKKQVGSGSTSLGSPKKLLVPPELEFVAQKLYVGGNLSTVQDDNIHRNKYVPYVVNELSDSDYTGYTATGWYLFGEMLKPMVVSFLNGQENPTVESADADFSTLGVQFRGYHDFGVDFAEWMSGTKSKGAA